MMSKVEAVLILIVISLTVILSIVLIHKPETATQPVNPISDSLKLAISNINHQNDSIKKLNSSLLEESMQQELQIGLLKFRISQLHDQIFNLDKHDFRVYQDSIYANQGHALQ